MSKEKVALFGGSFNPPHIGHTMIISYALSQHVNRVLVVPAYKHPLGKELSSFDHRCHMAKLAFDFLGDKVLISGIEKFYNISRTLDIIEILYKINPDIELHLLVGSDILDEKDKWYKFEKIEELAPLIVLEREGYTNERSVIIPRISSTYVRVLIERGKNSELNKFLHPDVIRYIEKNELYKSR